MHLDERLEKSREVIGKQFAVGQAKVSSAYNKLWADMEAMRKAQRERQEEQRLAQEKEAKQPSRSTPSHPHHYIHAPRLTASRQIPHARSPRGADARKRVPLVMGLVGQREAQRLGGVTQHVGHARVCVASADERRPAPQRHQAR